MVEHAVMLDKLEGRHGAQHSSGHVPTTDRVDLERLLAAVRRQWLCVAAFVLAFVMLAIAYIANATPIYTATARLLMDMNNVQLGNSFSEQTFTPSSDAAVTSQIQILKSQRLAERVVEQMDLLRNDEFMTPIRGVAGRAVASVRSLLGLAAQTNGPINQSQADKADILQFATGKLMSNFDAARVTVTFVLEISYTDPNPKLARDILDAYAKAYVSDQLEAKYAAQRDAGTWLQTRIDELRDRALKADLAVQDFRAAHNLMAVSATGQLLSEQQMSGASTQLSEAEDALARSDARYKEIAALITKGDVGAVVPEALQSSVINGLRNKYFDASKARTELVGKVGPGHEQVIRLTKSMSDYQKLIFEELSRIAGSYQNEADVARSKVDLLKARLRTASGATSADNTTLVQLRELERESESYKTLYQTFLERRQQTIQQQSFPVPDSRVIDAASALPVPTSPRSGIIILLAIVLGGSIGAGVGLGREYRDRAFRTGDQIRDALGENFLGYIPVLHNRATPMREGRAGEIHKAASVLNFAVESPFSAAAEALRNAKVTVDMKISAPGPRVIGIVSVLPGEGKTTIAANLAELLAAGGGALLIDCDFRNPSLTKSMAPHREFGIQDCIDGTKTLSDVMFTNSATGLRMVPASIGKRGVMENLGNGASLKSVFQQASAFKYIVLDLPPLAATSDARILSSYVDAFVLVVEWGETARQAVTTTLANEPLIAERCAGVILNKVNLGRLGRYQSFGSTDYYRERIAAYYDHV
jgi:succinoglycan biosynthesis transport protein ExoP